jgi:uncharacterized protein (DUF486 family)
VNLLKNPVLWKAIGLLFASNVFMTFAWYGHLKFKSKPLLIVILVSWGIALFEYCLQVPANRIGSDVASAAQLKVIQEVITFLVFAVFSYLYLRQSPTVNDAIAFAMIVVAVSISLFQPFS